MHDSHLACMQILLKPPIGQMRPIDDLAGPFHLIIHQLEACNLFAMLLCFFANCVEGVVCCMRPFFSWNLFLVGSFGKRDQRFRRRWAKHFWLIPKCFRKPSRTTSLCREHNKFGASRTPLGNWNCVAATSFFARWSQNTQVQFGCAKSQGTKENNRCAKTRCENGSLALDSLVRHHGKANLCQTLAQELRHGNQGIYALANHTLHKRSCPWAP